MKLPANYIDVVERWVTARPVDDGQIPGRRCPSCHREWQRFVYSRTRRYSRHPSDLMHEWSICETCWWRPKAPRPGDPLICALCLEPLVYDSHSPHDPLGPTIDHIWPVSRGGNDNAPNLQTVHHRCNSRKGNRVGAELDRWFPNRLNRERDPTREEP